MIIGHCKGCYWKTPAGNTDGKRQKKTSLTSSHIVVIAEALAAQPQTTHNRVVTVNQDTSNGEIVLYVLCTSGVAGQVRKPDQCTNECINECVRIYDQSQSSWNNVKA